MPDRSRLWRQFLTSPWLQAGALAVLATILAAALWSAAPATYAALDSAAYDFWLRHRAAVSISTSLIVVTREPASEEEFGVGPWDRGVLARFLTAAHEAGAVAIGLNDRLDHASPAQLGGAASDALFVEAMKAAGSVVLIQSVEPPLISDAAIFSHEQVAHAPDHVVRHVPVAVATGSSAVPAFGIALYELFHTQAVPATQTPSIQSESLLINYAGDGTLNAFPALAASALWNAIERHDSHRIAEWFKGKVVVFLTSPVSGSGLLPTGQTVGNSIVHVHLLNMLLTDDRLSELGTTSRTFLTLIVAWFMAWFLLSARDTRALFLAGSILALYAGLILIALVTTRLVLPFALPMTAGLLALLGAALWNQLTAHQRVRLLEQDMLRLQQDAAAVREALVLRETRAETLQEDLAIARTAVSHSADQRKALSQATEVFKAQLNEVQAQEEEARRQLGRLEEQLHGLRASTIDPIVLGDTELERLREECRQLGIITQDTGLLHLYRDLKKGARSPLTVLLLGEPGTGKELFARAVHRLSPRTGKPFIAVNMAAISPELFESELFGHTKGSFTGATADRRGYFELANHGTIFLDEIGDLRSDHQSKLLRVLQERSFYRVGATTATTVDVRIVAATNRDLQRGVSEGWFREDLYFRLTGLVFQLPPLRGRPGDVPVLAEMFLGAIATQMGKPVPRLSNEALRTLVEHEWKGNVRQLRHCLEQAIVLNDGPLLSKESLRLGGDTVQPAERSKPMLPDPAGDAAVLHCLRQHGFDMQASARTLGWDRSTVTQRLKGLCFQALVESNGDQAKAALVIAGDPSHLRTVELKLMDYHNHLLSVIEPFETADEALLDCKRRYKNLPERHFDSVETLVRSTFVRKQTSRPV